MKRNDEQARKTGASRRDFLKTAGIVTTGALVGGLGAFGAVAQNQRERKPQIKPELVQEFVRVSHSDLDKVKELLAEEPGLLNAAWDWQAGDFESGLGAAAHMGRQDIAMHLLENGATMTLFASAMLGKIEIVRPTIELYPGLADSKGAHGIPLLSHAKRGGDDAKEVADFLESIGAKE